MAQCIRCSATLPNPVPAFCPNCGQSTGQAGPGQAILSFGPQVVTMPPFQLVAGQGGAGAQATAPATARSGWPLWLSIVLATLAGLALAALITFGWIGLARHATTAELTAVEVKVDSLSDGITKIRGDVAGVAATLGTATGILVDSTGAMFDPVTGRVIAPRLATQAGLDGLKTGMDAGFTGLRSAIADEGKKTRGAVWTVRAAIPPAVDVSSLARADQLNGLATAQALTEHDQRVMDAIAAAKAKITVRPDGSVSR